MDPARLSPSAKRVQEALAARDIDLQVVEMAVSTRTAAEAADAVGCEVGQIVKSLVFMGRDSGHPILFVVSGANRVDIGRVSSIVGEPLVKPDAEYVRLHTGFAIGGVPPVGHVSPLRTFMDQDLLEHPQIWAAAGTPNALFALTPNQIAGPDSRTSHLGRLATNLNVRHER